MAKKYLDDFKTVSRVDKYKQQKEIDRINKFAEGTHQISKKKANFMHCMSFVKTKTNDKNIGTSLNLIDTKRFMKENKDPIWGY